MGQGSSSGPLAFVTSLAVMVPLWRRCGDFLIATTLFSALLIARTAHTSQEAGTTAVANSDLVLVAPFPQGFLCAPRLIVSQVGRWTWPCALLLASCCFTRVSK